MSEFDAERSIRLRVLTPEQVLFDGPVDWVQVPLSDGLLGVWPGHAPLIGAVDDGEATFSLDGEIHRLPVTAGFLRIDATCCVILCGALAVSQIPERDVESLATQFENTLREYLTEDELEGLGINE